MEEEYQTFKTFPDRETAESFADVLQQNAIPFLIAEDRLTFDPSYAHNPLNKDYRIKIYPQDFTRATAAYEAYFARLVNNVSSDYYLYTFSDEELMEIMTKPDEWGSFDYLLAQKILADRGIHFTKAEKEALKTKRYKELEKPEQEAVSNIVAYYLVSLLFFPVGIIIGWVWGYSKKTLPNGQRVHAYDSNVQKHGRIIFGLAICIFIVLIFLRVTDNWMKRAA